MNFKYAVNLIKKKIAERVAEKDFSGIPGLIYITAMTEFIKIRERIAPNDKIEL